MSAPVSTERLAGWKRWATGGNIVGARVFLEAVAEIERLQAENERLATALLLHCGECADAALSPEPTS
jgi:hypothetical protein